MSQHPNARLTPRGRALLCERVGGGMRIADAARDGRRVYLIASKLRV